MEDVFKNVKDVSKVKPDRILGDESQGLAGKLANGLKDLSKLVPVQPLEAKSATIGIRG